MNTKYSRDDLLTQLEETLSAAGARPSCWPDDCRARLAAFIETDPDAARLFAEAKALDRVLASAPKCRPRAGFEADIVSAALKLPQNRGGGAGTVLGFGNGLQRRSAGESGHSPMPAPSFWGGGALLAASLMLGIYIGVSGNAVPTLRNIELLASNDLDTGFAISGSLFGPGELDESDQL